MASNGTSQPRTYAPDFSTRYQPFFGVALFQTEAQKRGRSFLASQTERSETRSSIFPRPISPSPPLVYPSQTTRYLQKRQSSLGFLRPNWQFRLSGISGALSFIRRRNSGCHLPSAPLFKVGNTLPTFLLKSPPPSTCPPSDAGRNRIGFAIRHGAVLQSGHVAAAWNIVRYSRKMKTFHASIIYPFPSILGRGSRSLSNTFCSLQIYVCEKNFNFQEKLETNLFFFFCNNSNSVAQN